MPAVERFDHQFVEFIPSSPYEGVIYVSLEYRTIVHLCACGCGTKVVCNLSPTASAMTFDGESITINPSIGNWSFDCRSHYFIRQNCVAWIPAKIDQRTGNDDFTTATKASWLQRFRRWLHLND